MSLRVAALAAKFGFVVVLALFLEPAEVGQYGLVVATIGFSLYFVGLDFYVYANREFRVADTRKRATILSQMAYLFCATYAVLIPSYLLLFSFGLLPWSLVYFVICLSVLEHLATELYRMLIIVGRPVLASFSLFLRLGFWPLIAAGAMWLVPEVRVLSNILYFWVFGAILSIAVPALVIARQITGFSFGALNWDWIKTGLKITLPFLVGTLCLRAIQTLDRYIVNDLVGPDVLGAFVFFASLAGVIPAMLQAGVYAFAVPQLISLAHDKNWDAFRNRMRKLRAEISVSVFFLAIGVLICARLAMWFVDNPIYSANHSLLYFALAANGLFAASMYFHLGLYAMRRDRVLAISHVFALLAFLAVTIVTAYYSKYYAVPIGIVFGSLCVLAMKIWFYRKASRSVEVSA